MALLDVWIYRYYAYFPLDQKLAYLIVAAVAGAVVAGRPVLVPRARAGRDGRPRPVRVRSRAEAGVIRLGLPWR